MRGNIFLFFFKENKFFTIKSIFLWKRNIFFWLFFFRETNAKNLTIIWSLVGSCGLRVLGCFLSFQEESDRTRIHWWIDCHVFWWGPLWRNFNCFFSASVASSLFSLSFFLKQSTENPWQPRSKIYLFTVDTITAARCTVVTGELLSFSSYLVDLALHTVAAARSSGVKRHVHLKTFSRTKWPWVWSSIFPRKRETESSCVSEASESEKERERSSTSLPIGEGQPPVGGRRSPPRARPNLLQL